MGQGSRHVLIPASAGFVPWGTDHQAVLLVTALTACALIVGRRRLRAADDRWLRRGLAAALVANELTAWVAASAHGVVRVPLQLCDLALFATVWALLSLRRSVAEVAYFWGLAGSLQAVLTPDLAEPFPSYWWMKFFVGHCGIVLSVVYLAVTGRVAPSPRSVWRLWLWTNVYAAVIGLVNWGFGTNYGYLARKPMQPSLLDSFGPWPYYIVVMEVAALLSFCLYYAPFVVGRRLAQRLR